MAAPIGNRNARKAKEWRDQIKWALENYEGDDCPKGMALRKIATLTVEEALKGDKAARDEIANRLDGKPAQAIVGGDEDDSPVTIKGIIELVRPG